MPGDGYASFLEYLTQQHLSLAGYDPGDFLYGHNGPCPQIARDHPFGQVPEILDIPEQETIEWDKHVRSYYRSEGFMLELGEARIWRRRRWAESGGHGYAEVPDAMFLELMTEGLYSKFLCHTLDAQDRARFAAILQEDPGADYWKSDYSCMAAIRKTRDAENYVAPTVVLMKQTASRKFEVVAIDLRYWDGNDYEYIDAPLKPANTDAWRLAKYFVLQGAIHRINLIDHGKVHFPCDVVNAITKTALPTRHLVHQLLMPHFFLTLPVNNAVLEGEKSLISRNGTYPYSPFAAEKREVRRLLSLGWYGWRYYWSGDNASYPPYSFTVGPPDLPSVYGDYMKTCYAPIYEFVREIVELLPDKATAADWIEIQSWAAQISGWLPGFPEWSEFNFDDAGREKSLDTLAKVLATIIHNAAVVHSCDHASLHWMIQNRPVPFILRVPPPHNATDKAVISDTLKQSFDGLFDFISKTFLDSETPMKPWTTGHETILCHPEDLESTCWADLLFYRAHNTTLLIDCEYEFKDDKAKAAVVRFREALAFVSDAQKELVKDYHLPWINPADGGDVSDKFKKRHCIGAGIQY
ncbi:MAG TPA: lipoxygenase family protein [Candidatus Limnocylindrales bacterium]|nr:lipoxygenase family protein [Candidatus Limnocylindrales bacterium]